MRPVPARVEPDLPHLPRQQIGEEVHRNRNSRRRLQDSIGHAFFGRLFFDGWEKKTQTNSRGAKPVLQIGGSMFAKLKREEQKKEANRRQNMCNTYTLRGLKMRI